MESHRRADGLCVQLYDGTAEPMPMTQHGIQHFGSKVALLEAAVTGKNVLHIGAIGETGGGLKAKLAAADRSVHAALTRSAASCVGVDIDREAVDALIRSKRFTNLVALDATKMQRGDVPLSSIDVIVAGDILEHLPNPGELLARLRAIADPDTVLVLTTPNGVGLPQLLRYLRGLPLEGSDHRCSFNIYSLSNLLHACGWEIRSSHTCYQAAASGKHSAIGFWLGLKLLTRFPALGGTLLVHCELSRPGPASAVS